MVLLVSIRSSYVPIHRALPKNDPWTVIQRPHIRFSGYWRTLYGVRRVQAQMAHIPRTAYFHAQEPWENQRPNILLSMRELQRQSLHMACRTGGVACEIREWVKITLPGQMPSMPSLELRFWTWRKTRQASAKSSQTSDQAWSITAWNWFAVPKQTKMDALAYVFQSSDTGGGFWDAGCSAIPLLRQ